jgi:hypothetical protein
MAAATTDHPGARGGHRAEGHGFGPVLFASALLVVIGDLARAANLLAGALMVRLICVFLATPGTARPSGPRSTRLA